MHTVVEFQVQDILNFGLLKPWEVFVRQKELLLANKHPNPMDINVSYFRLRNPGATAIRIMASDSLKAELRTLCFRAFRCL